MDIFIYLKGKSTPLIPMRGGFVIEPVHCAWAGAMLTLI